MPKNLQGESERSALIELKSPVIDHKISQIIAESIALEQEEISHHPLDRRDVRGKEISSAQVGLRLLRFPLKATGSRQLQPYLNITWA